MERLRFFKEGSNFLILNATEEVAKGADLLKSYFWVFTGHGSKRDHAWFRTDFASFYTMRIPAPLYLREKGFEVEEVDLKVTVEDGIFYDQRNQEIDLSLFKPQKVIYIYVDGKRAGVYFVESKVLIATDWTHSPACIRTLERLMPYLSKIFRKRSKLPPKPKFSIMFGADPEFEVIDLSGKVISASGIIAGGTDPKQEIGRDGAGAQVEIRPKPESDLSKFIINVRNILKKFAAEYPRYSLSVQGDTYPLGGHIHLSLPPDRNILQLLDNWIGGKVIHLSGGARGSYKKLSAYETKPWGFEYRTPPAAIFLKPQVLFAVLKIMKAVLKGYFSNNGVSLYPTPGEIDRLKIKKEWEILNRFIEEYPKMSKDLLKQWRIKVKVEPKVDVIFKDDWASEVRDFVRALFLDKVKGLVKKVNAKGIFKIVFFGFKNERGLVCNFDSDIFERIDFNYPVGAGEVAFGFPYSIRVAELTEELKQKWGKVIDEVVSNLLK